MHENDNKHIKYVYLGRYIVRYMVRNHVLCIRSGVTLNQNFRPYNQWYTSPNKVLNAVTCIHKYMTKTTSQPSIHLEQTGNQHSQLRVFVVYYGSFDLMDYLCGQGRLFRLKDLSIDEMIVSCCFGCCKAYRGLTVGFLCSCIQFYVLLSLSLCFISFLYLIW